ncbi:Ger(x)C family spore germination C-terminal domain-containing protein [Moorella naiadis]|uniref:Ger(x)C family spore germination protein n=1 Tax=Moorella naiadis (nom. illeg.) TaxID=3093670 RepID=UPI003D9CBCA8
MRVWCRRLLAGVLLACGLPLLTGCWSRHEIEDLAIVMAAALDTAPGNQVRLSVYVVIPRAVGGGPSMGGGGGGEPKKAGEIISATGSDYSQAARRLEGQVPRRLYWAQNRVLVIGADLARRGLYYLDLFIRDRQMRLITPVLITRGEARRVLDLPPGIELNTGTILTGILRNHTTFKVELKDLLAMWEAPGDNPALPEVVMTPTPEQGSQAPGGGGGQDAGRGGKEGEKKQQPEAVVIKGAGAFRYDRLVGWLDERETNGLMWLRGEVTEGVITVSLPPGVRGPLTGQGPGRQKGQEQSPDAGQGQGASPGEDQGPGQGGAPSPRATKGERRDLPLVQTPTPTPARASIAFHRINTNTQARVQGQQVVFTVHIKGHGDLLEVIGNFNPDNLDQLRVIQEAVNKEIADRARAVVAKAQQELRTDLFGFGEILHRSNTRYWHQVQDHWNDEFPRAQVQVEVEIQLRRVGMTNRTPGIIRAAGGKSVTQGNTR